MTRLQPEPELSSLSEPVEPVFRELLEKAIEDSYNYGLAKYGVPLHSFNGHSELHDFAEEMVSGFRYTVQLAMRCHKLEGLLIQVMNVVGESPLETSYSLKPLWDEVREAIKDGIAGIDQENDIDKS